MHKLTLCLLALLLSLSSIAQQNQVQPKQEIGLAFRGLGSFGLIYRAGNEEALWRFRLMNASAYSDDEESDSIGATSDGLDIDFLIGREFRQPLNDKFTLRYGVDIGAGVDFDRSTNRIIEASYSVDNYYRSDLYRANFNLVFGANYQLHENLIFGMEILPGGSYTFGETKRRNTYGTNNREYVSDVSNWDFDLSLTRVLMTLAYQF